mgnify:CR=1 FL=1
MRDFDYIILGGGCAGLSLAYELDINNKFKNTTISTKGRHDPCVGLRAVPIAEAMMALVLMDHFLRNRAQNADVESETPDIPSNN